MGNFMEIKAINITQKEIYNEEDFFLSGEVFIGPQNEAYSYEVFDFNVISIKRLYNEFTEYGIMLNRRWLITKYYDESELRGKINSIICSCIDINKDKTYSNIASCLRKQES